MQSPPPPLSRPLPVYPTYAYSPIPPFPGPFSPPHGPLHFIEGSRLLNFLPFSNNISVPWASLRSPPHPTQDPTCDYYLIYNQARTPRASYRAIHEVRGVSLDIANVSLRLHIPRNELVPARLYARRVTTKVSFEELTERCVKRYGARCKDKKMIKKEMDD